LELDIKTVLVTGGTGFIGSHTVEQLIAQGYRVKCLVRLHNTNLKWLQNLQIEPVKGDLLNPRSLLKSLEDVEYIIHIAGVTKAKQPIDFYNGNVRATYCLLQAANHFAHLKKFCYISSLTAVGPSSNGTPLTETAHCRPITTYGKSKLEAENICKRFMDKIPITILRPPAVFGPRDTDILEMFKWINHGLKPVIGSAEKTLSLVYAPDLADAIVQATFDERTEGEIYNIADQTIFTFSSLMDYLATFANKRTIKVHLTRGMMYSMAGIMQFVSYLGNKPAVLNIEKARDLLQKHWVCDPTKIQKHIGFQTTTSIYDGLDKTFRWYKEMKWL
jgi:dihydroflavonol-4-reductase